MRYSPISPSRGSTTPMSSSGRRWSTPAWNSCCGTSRRRALPRKPSATRTASGITARSWRGRTPSPPCSTGQGSAPAATARIRRITGSSWGSPSASPTGSISPSTTTIPASWSTAAPRSVPSRWRWSIRSTPGSKITINTSRMKARSASRMCRTAWCWCPPASPLRPPMRTRPKNPSPISSSTSA